MPTALDKPKVVNRDEKGRLMKGSVLNPGGTPKACYKAMEVIESAIADFEKEKGVPYWRAATLIAMKLANEGNTSLLAKILDKFVASKIQGEGFANSGVYVYIVRDGKVAEGRDSNRIALCATPEPARDTK